jgi:hypothetical protein
MCCPRLTILRLINRKFLLHLPSKQYGSGGWGPSAPESTTIKITLVGMGSQGGFILSKAQLFEEFSTVPAQLVGDAAPQAGMLLRSLHCPGQVTRISVDSLHAKKTMLGYSWCPEPHHAKQNQPARDLPSRGEHPEYPGQLQG